MKIVIADFKHETNTFSPVPTPWESFGPGGPYLGEAVIGAYEGTRTGTGGFIDLAREIGASIVTPVAANPVPSGPVEAGAYRRVCDLVLEAVAAGCDALFLDLHGAMVVEDEDDGEGALLARIRALAPGLPVAVALDLHANLTEAMVANADVIVGYRTYPHVDHWETAQRAGRILLAKMRGQARPAMAWGHRPMLAHTLRMATEESPMRELLARARALEAAGTLAATVFGGFAQADFRDAGPSVVVVADGDAARARRECDALLEDMWRSREGFVYRSEPLARSIARARGIAGGPVLLVDHGDNCFSGGTCDVMDVLAEALRQGLSDILAGPIWDAEAVARMIDAGVGARLTLPVGGKADMPAIGRRGTPLELSGVVRAISDGEYVVTGPTQTGVRAFMGRTAVLDTGAARVVVCERTHEPWDLAVFRGVGIEPSRSRYVLIKSRMYYRPVFGPIAKAVVECDSLGVTTSDYAITRPSRVRRPIYPLDPL